MNIFLHPTVILALLLLLILILFLIYMYHLNQATT